MTCPADGEKVRNEKISAIPRSIQNMLAKLSIECPICNHVMKLCKYENHNCFQDILQDMGIYINELESIEKALLKLQF